MFGFFKQNAEREEQTIRLMRAMAAYDAEKAKAERVRGTKVYRIGTETFIATEGSSHTVELSPAQKYLMNKGILTK